MIKKKPSAVERIPRHEFVTREEAREREKREESAAIELSTCESGHAVIELLAYKNAMIDHLHGLYLNAKKDGDALDHLFPERRKMRVLR